MKNENSIIALIKDLIDSIIYFRESKKGKFSLNTYLDIVEQYADRQIIESEKNEGIIYLGGTCEVYNIPERGMFCFNVKLYFQTQDGKSTLKEASRELPYEKFTSETRSEIGQGKILKIHRPKQEDE